MSPSANRQSAPQTLVQFGARTEAAQFIPPHAPVILRLPAVEAQTGLKKTALYEKVKAGDFPRPVAIGTRARGWLASEVAAWIESRAALRT